MGSEEPVLETILIDVKCGDGAIYEGMRDRIGRNDEDDCLMIV